MGVNKCSIPSLALEKLKKYLWGFECENVDDIILENYIGFLNCSTVKPKVCHPDDCTNETIHFTCTIALAGISFTIDDRQITFFIEDGDLTNFLAPLSYVWTYETEDFEQANPIDTASSVLILKGSKQFDLLVTKISVTITDANGCSVTKNCYFVEGEIFCDDYVPCSNPSNLRVVNNFTRCSAPLNLTVTSI